MRVAPPDAGCKQIDVNGRRYTVGRDGLFHDVRPADAAAMRSGGEAFIPGVGFAHTTRFYVCTGCGRRVHFTTCGRCGAPATRNGAADAPQE